MRAARTKQGRRRQLLTRPHGGLDRAAERSGVQGDTGRGDRRDRQGLEYLKAGHGVVCTMSTSVLDRRATLAGTEPSNRPAMVLSPTLPTTSRSAFSSRARSTSASTGAPTIA